VIRLRSATLTLAALAFALGCSSQSSAPGAAHGSSNLQPAPSDDAPERREPPAAEAQAEEEMSAPAAEPAMAAPGGASRAAAAKDKAAAPARMKIAEPMASGLDRDIIRRKVQDHEADLQACVANPELTGTLAVKLEIDARGVIKDVELAPGSEVDEREVVDCILAIVSTWSFAGEAKGKASAEIRLELSN
jgi:pyruvate/2-oxoglutarate dehydrogenase complex dihydrolipoamide acyltransferase (E2) component